MGSESEKRSNGNVVQRLTGSIHPSPENSILYRDRTASDADFMRLVESVRERGIQSPILVSGDDYIISGHQRHKAAVVAGLTTVPIIVLRLRYMDHSESEWIAILREHNTGREKTFDELVREKLVDIDPDEAVQQIVDDRIERTTARIPTIDIGTKVVRRHGISNEKRGMADAVLAVLREIEDYLPVSLRAIHYRLLPINFWRNSKTKTRYENNRNCYADLSDLITSTVTDFSKMV